jgi:hypothetical protein
MQVGERHMSDYSRSDLRDIESKLEAIKDGILSERLARMTQVLERVVSRLDDISRKLDQR